MRKWQKPETLRYVPLPRTLDEQLEEYDREIKFDQWFGGLMLLGVAICWAIILFSK